MGKLPLFGHRGRPGSDDDSVSHFSDIAEGGGARAPATLDATTIPAVGVTDMAIVTRSGTGSAVVLGGITRGDSAPAPANTAVTAPAAAGVAVDTAVGASVAPDVGADIAVDTAAGVAASGVAADDTPSVATASPPSLVSTRLIWRSTWLLVSPLPLSPPLMAPLTDGANMAADDAAIGVAAPAAATDDTYASVASAADAEITVGSMVGVTVPTIAMGDGAPTPPVTTIAAVTGMAVDTDAMASVAADDAHASGASVAGVDMAVDMATGVTADGFAVTTDDDTTRGIKRGHTDAAVIPSKKRRRSGGSAREAREATFLAPCFQSIQCHRQPIGLGWHALCSSN